MRTSKPSMACILTGSERTKRPPRPRRLQSVGRATDHAGKAKERRYFLLWMPAKRRAHYSLFFNPRHKAAKRRGR